ncbi:YbhB/YbcL family Raf kinase inhibitor-like protein [Alkalilimnicola sp. S0819]|uniref:YbhB/YbcL family Raf kinase inhibitor-like protein n=1 Tax=Alkalilimnicola sp. S0819 TaxID=2613922 RepID=UPI001261F24B|nr:YbhB/YbcL family Raf kinase inhibitor-like protein [Alkalilimnicola sp. S0819]KAB7624442.1 YbhB/YbcL family Raf kinase inhibitor-like protein [Alkalilimnicola sp. S0819]MPQ16275.1 YbhB/YbcL family Raf kinase inhibitor-like protein [Alkalilimnicola sp. S0819]
MRLFSDSIRDGEVMPGRFAFAVPDPEQHVRLSDNRSPHLGWSGLPEGTRSLVLICHDPDVPSKPDDVNQEGRQVPAELPRVDFFHWVLVDLAPAVSELAEAEASDRVTARGKPGPQGPRGSRQGLNSYTDWFQGDADMEGRYYGYDGPCPPWNDSIAHRYRFTLYATDLERCPVGERFTGPDVLAAIEGHVLDQASLTVRYSLNPDVPA